MRLTRCRSGRVSKSLVGLAHHGGVSLVGERQEAGNAAGLLRRGSYRPVPGWGVFALQVIAASALLAIFLMWGAASFPWIGLRAERLQRVGLLAILLLGAGAIYFGALAAAGVKLRQFVTR